VIAALATAPLMPPTAAPSPDAAPASAGRTVRVIAMNSAATSAPWPAPKTATSVTTWPWPWWKPASRPSAIDSTQRPTTAMSCGRTRCASRPARYPAIVIVTANGSMSRPAPSTDAPAP
jgi:hypothetical protein